MLITRHHATRVATYWYCTGGRAMHSGIAQVLERYTYCYCTGGRALYTAWYCTGGRAAKP